MLFSLAFLLVKSSDIWCSVVFQGTILGPMSVSFTFGASLSLPNDIYFIGTNDVPTPWLILIMGPQVLEKSVTPCRLRNLAIIFNAWFSNLCYRLIPWGHVTLISVQCHRAPFILCQHWFRKWLGSMTQQAIIWASMGSYQYHHIVSLGHNELISIILKNDLERSIYLLETSWLIDAWCHILHQLCIQLIPKCMVWWSANFPRKDEKIIKFIEPQFLER